MIDPKALLRNAKNISLIDLILVQQCYRELKQGKGQLKRVFERLGMKEVMAYRRIHKVETSLFKKTGTLFDLRPGRGASRAVGDPEIMEAIDDLVSVFGNIQSTTMPRLKVRFGATNICQLRLVPEIYQRFRRAFGGGSDSQWSRKSTSDTTFWSVVDVEFVQGEWLELCEALEKGELHFALTAMPPTKPIQFQDTIHEIARVQIPRCVVYPMDHPFNQEGSEWDKLFHSPDPRDQDRAWTMLIDETLIILDNQDAEPNFPWDSLSVERSKRVRVQTYAEAHAHCIAGGGIAFTHQELLSEAEEGHLTVVDASKKLRTTCLCGLRSNTAMKRCTRDELQVVQQLEEDIHQYLHDMNKRVQNPHREFRKLDQYRFLWHTTTGKKDRPVWVPVHIRLQTTPGGFIKGTEYSEPRKIWFRVFGHILDEHAIWHGLSENAESHMRGPEQEHTADEFVDHYAIDFHLRSPLGSVPLAGMWIGRDYAARGRSGVAVLATEAIHSPEKLQQIVRSSGISHVDTARALTIARTQRDL